jgi:ATP-dependent RNA helicase DeaD
MSDSSPPLSFAALGLPPALLTALDSVGYETPSPIQAATIPHLLAGADLLGHAPTGTGKTAAFALPLLAKIDLGQRAPQVLVLTPTRELALQVAEAFQRYASALSGFHVLPIYGGSDYGGQIRQLKRGVHLVVGTPGRIMDHMRKGTLRLDGLQALVLDEADEMLRMGFIDDVEWILEQTPPKRQIALFSATLPSAIQRIAQRYLHEPQSISIEAATATAETIRQRYWLVSGMHKLDALTRILEVEPFDGLLLFVRTKTATTELAARLGARGWSAAALNGDMPQQQREQMVEQLRSGALDILVATDVAARGLDVERISHVVNYDIPYDTEAYIHRIGRTGRAGRAGEAILFVAPRERRMLAAIERATRQRIEPLTLPSTETVNNKRIADFKQRITDTLAAGELSFMQSLIEQYQEEHDVPALEIAAALAKLSIGDQPLLLTAPERPARAQERGEQGRGPRREDPTRPRQQRRSPSPPDQGMERFRIAVGHRNGVKPGNIVGAIANEAGLDARHIGRIDIEDEFSLVDLPTGMPRELLQDLRKVRVCGRPLAITRVAADSAQEKTAAGRPAKGDAGGRRRGEGEQRARGPKPGPSPAGGRGPGPSGGPSKD